MTVSTPKSWKSSKKSSGKPHKPCIQLTKEEVTMTGKIGTKNVPDPWSTPWETLRPLFILEGKHFTCAGKLFTIEGNFLLARENFFPIEGNVFTHAGNILTIEGFFYHEKLLLLLCIWTLQFKVGQIYRKWFIVTHSTVFKQ